MEILIGSGIDASGFDYPVELRLPSGEHILGGRQRSCQHEPPAERRGGVETRWNRQGPDRLRETAHLITFHHGGLEHPTRQTPLAVK